eukprot:3137171-Pyramimonas_sp.AAC.1
MWNYESQTRVYKPLPFNLPHEVFAAEAEAHPAEWNPAGYDDLPRALYNHPVYQSHGPKAVPL